MPDFCIDWFAGATAQVELFSPEQTTDVYQLKYTSPFRSTIRPPAQPTRLGADELSPISEKLDELAKAMGVARAPGVRPAVTGGYVPEPIEEQLQLAGEMLEMLVLPHFAQADLRVGEFFLEIGVDEKLVGYPWELMHDGEQFLCLRHFVGRFVNATSRVSVLSEKETSPLGMHVDPLSVLLVSVPKPQRRKTLDYEELEEAKVETEVVSELLADTPGVALDVLVQKDATFDAMFRKLKERRYDIVHFIGHAVFDEKSPNRSGLVLFDRDMATGAIANFFGTHPPLLCFVNACDSARSEEWQSNYNIFSVARAFLETGTYLLGSRWKLTDVGAAEFAKSFYQGLLRDELPLGKAVTQARHECKKKCPINDLAWASYVLYGDPRVHFRRLATA